MDSFGRRVLTSLIAIAIATSASAQNRQPNLPTRTTSSREAPATLTGKERLGRKWTDEQRIDNCNVPINKRGAKPRPSACAQTGS